MEAIRRANRGIVAVGLSLAACTSTQPLSIDQFEATLDSHDSATEALTQWCSIHHMAEPPVIRAIAANGESREPPAGLRELLDIASDAPLGYRHVQLVCGDTVLSEAHNWFVPSRLSGEMNHVLETTDTPFGTAVATLDFTRRKLASMRSGPECPDGTILTQRALLLLPDGQPISLVMECYTSANLTPGW
ncbi:hypothetical protein MB02_14655 [Croceicoccus estronivorus]|uniref:hypothetical protein n=1 Tax=Croceicoccus estronivorus TaxID=1172626 RepID=UPI0008342FDF|nr:hypothetical protein [Croceicoccus estronivorus]OCC22996.1 hypothetical protein MB02_14655 [Croceicoccus estronivorus]